MELIDFNPMFGRWTFAGEDPHTGETVISEKFDKAHAIKTVDRTKLQEREGFGKGESVRLHCNIPPYVQVEIIQKYGVDLRQPGIYPWLRKIIETEYPHLVVNKA